MTTFEERALQRASWPIRRFDLGREPLVDERDVSSPTERIQLALQLTREQWAAAGRTWPTYERAHMPGRLIRPKP